MCMEPYQGPGASPGDILDRTLNREDVNDISERLLGLQNKPKLLSRALKLPLTVIDSVPKRTQTSEVLDALIYVIESLVRQVEPRPTWRLILDALKSQLMNEAALSKQIEEDIVPKSTCDSELPSATAGPQSTSTVDGLCSTQKKQPIAPAYRRSVSDGDSRRKSQTPIAGKFLGPIKSSPSIILA
jgi:hypothetical protein